MPKGRGSLLLSSKGIWFTYPPRILQKGLARELIPKYMGPYRICQDYKNLSFKIDLSAELKKRGIHNVFHLSLLRINVPNNNRLFLGRQKTQLGNGPKVEKEWAVEEILSHHGIQGDTIFEMK
jgi:hypothetical protein